MNSAPGFASTARASFEAEWKAVLEHPFLVGLGDGSLPRDAFQRYMIQDYLFLIEYSRVLGLAAAKSTKLDAMGRMAELLHATLNVEMALHREFAARVGIAAQELEHARQRPACHAYTSHLLSVGWSQSPAVIAAALLPCQLGYAEIAEQLAARGRPNVPEYAEWIDVYRSDEYVSLARWLAGHTDALAAEAGARERERMLEVYRESLRLEHAFWGLALSADGCKR